MILRVIACLAAAAAAGAVLAPSSRTVPAIADGVSVGGVAVGGLTSEPARAAIERAYARPLEVSSAGRSWTVRRADLGVRVSTEAAVEAAVRAAAGDRLPAEAHVSGAAVRGLVARLARQVARTPVDAKLVGFGAKPLFAPAKPGLAVRAEAAVRRIERALADASATSVSLPVRPVAPARTAADFGSVIVIDRGANTLRLFDGTKLVRTFRVATGQAVYPTPSGLWHIVDKQLNPWWYPPTYDSWAKGLKPVPPGPANPLGTRWMGLSAPGVGIHGTPQDGSIGYSLSHGCIRMHIPEAEWLFDHVDVGTTVYIVSS